MKHHDRQAARCYRFDAHGNLLLATPLRWFTFCDKPGPELPIKVLFELCMCYSGVWGYREAAADDELSRRRPQSASICTDAKKGWEPLLFVDTSAPPVAE